MQNGVTYHGTFSDTREKSTTPSITKRIFTRYSLKEYLAWAFISLGALAVTEIGMINVFLYPDCNRETRDCFLVHHLWRQ
jgi:hypothetical protein